MCIAFTDAQRDDAGNVCIDVLEPELQRALALSTEDLRFMDYVLSTALGGDDDVRWEGSDEWCRTQFRAYLFSLYATVRSGQVALMSDFNEHFVRAWQTGSHNYRVWASIEHVDMAGIVAG
jgi:hypothetical protein